MIKTKHVDLYKKKGYHDGVFYVNGVKYKVKAFDSKDVGYFDDEYEIEVYLYEFYKGRYKIIRIENWNDYSQKVEDAVNYIIDKAYSRNDISESPKLKTHNLNDKFAFIDSLGAWDGN